MIRILPLILAVALFMENMDGTVISTSLPVIAADLNTSPITLKLAMTSYLLALSIFIPISGWMADRFTARNVFRVAICVFLAGSVFCALSFSLETFVVSRFLQGMGGAMMTPIARLLLVRSTPKDELVIALAWFTVPALIGPLVGPLIGGFITTYYSWHWIFLINIPIGIIGLILATIFLPRDEMPIIRPLDWTGFILSGVALSGFILGLSTMTMPIIPIWVGITMVVIGLICGFLYVHHARTTAYPLLNLALFKNKVFRISITGGSFFRIGIGATPFLLPLMLQISFGYTPLQSGFVTFIGALGAISMKFGTNFIYNKFGFRKVLMAGALITACSTALHGTFTLTTPIIIMILIILIAGFLRSMFFTGVNALSYAQISKDELSQATPISAVAQQASIALGVTIAGFILETLLSFHGGELRLSDFHIAFFIVAGISALSFFFFLKLPSDAGNELTKKKKGRIPPL